jgi:hypothetical protein
MIQEQGIKRGEKAHYIEHHAEYDSPNLLSLLFFGYFMPKCGYSPSCPSLGCLIHESFDPYSLHSLLEYLLCAPQLLFFLLWPFTIAIIVLILTHELVVPVL